MTSIALVSREVAPFRSGGIGVAVAALAELLRELGDVTVILPDADERPAGLPDGVRYEFMPEPVEDAVWSARACERLRALYPHGGPDLVEFPDWRGEGAATAAAVRAGDPALRRTTVCVRLHGAEEIVEVLNGWLRDDDAARALFALERAALRDAGAVVWPFGDVLGTYRRFYGAGALGPDRRVPPPIFAQAAPAGPPEVDPAEELRLLYLGRYERRKGVHNLIHALTGIASDRWRLTLVGGDTPTGQLGTSMRAQLELAAAGDPRFAFVDALPREELPALIAEHHVLVVPSL